MAIGTLTCHVFDVEDLDIGQAFWAEVTGLEPHPVSVSWALLPISVSRIPGGTR